MGEIWLGFLVFRNLPNPLGLIPNVPIYLYTMQDALKMCSLVSIYTHTHTVGKIPLGRKTRRNLWSNESKRLRIDSKYRIDRFRLVGQSGWQRLILFGALKRLESNQRMQTKTRHKDSPEHDSTAFLETATTFGMSHSYLFRFGVKWAWHESDKLSSFRLKLAHAYSMSRKT